MSINTNFEEVFSAFPLDGRTRGASTTAPNVQGLIRFMTDSLEPDSNVKPLQVYTGSEWKQILLEGDEGGDTSANVAAIEANMAEIAAIATEVSANTIEITTNATAINTLDVAISDNTSNITAVLTTAANNSSSIVAMETDIFKVQSDISEVQSEIDSVEANITTLQTEPLGDLRTALPNLPADAELRNAVFGIDANTPLDTLAAMSTGTLLRALFLKDTLWQTVAPEIPVVIGTVTTVDLTAGSTSPGEHLINTVISGTFSLTVDPGYWSDNPIPYADATKSTVLTDKDPAHLTVYAPPSVILYGVDGSLVSSYSLASATLNIPQPALTESSASGYTFTPGTPGEEPEQAFSYTPAALGNVTLSVNGATLGPTATVYDDKGDDRSVGNKATSNTFETWTVYIPVYTLIPANAATSLANATVVATKLKEASEYQLFQDIGGVPALIGISDAVEFTMNADGGVAYVPYRNGVAPNYVNAEIVSGGVATWSEYNGSSQGELTTGFARHGVSYSKLMIKGASTSSNLKVRVGYGVTE